MLSPASGPRLRMTFTHDVFRSLAWGRGLLDFVRFSSGSREVCAGLAAR